MQAWPEDQQYSLTNARHYKAALYTVVFFSLAGLIAGFTFGGFAGRLSGKALGSSVPLASRQKPQPVATATPEGVSLGNPLIGTEDYVNTELADGSTSYTFSAQINSKNGQQPITATDVTCRFWLTDDLNATSAALSADNYAIPRSPAAFNQPFPHELVGALSLTASQAVQPCKAGGKTSWTYKLSPALQHGTYYLAVLADWRGIHYNWYMVSIEVPQGA